MNRRAQLVLRSTIALLLLLSLTVVTVHWHDDKQGRDCGLCYAHQMPGLQGTDVPLLTFPGVSERRSPVSEQVLVSHAFVPSHPGRAPPRSLSLIFG